MSLSEIGMLYTQRQDLGRNWIQSKVTTWSLFSTGISWTVNGYNSDQSPDAVYSLLIKNSRQSVIYLKNILSNPSSSETILNQSSLLRSELIPNTPYILPQTHSIPQLQLSSIYQTQSIDPIVSSSIHIIHTIYSTIIPDSFHQIQAQSPPAINNNSFTWLILV